MPAVGVQTSARAHIASIGTVSATEPRDLPLRRLKVQASPALQPPGVSSKRQGFVPSLGVPQPGGPSVPLERRGVEGGVVVEREKRHLSPRVHLPIV